MANDCVDSKFFNYLLRNRTNYDSSSSKVPFGDRHDDFYKITHNRRGVALIFNHQYFDNRTEKSRNGTDLDKNNLQNVFEHLDFDVRVYNDLKYGELHQVLKEVSCENHSDADCLVICVLSHGSEGKIEAKDHAYPPDILWSQFTGDRCLTLAGKPKLLFIQACRGDMVDDGVQMKQMKTETDSSNNDDYYTIPAMADILVMYATYQGFYAWRNPDKGSWFIQALCHELKENGHRFELLTLLTFVNRRVATLYQSNVPDRSDMNKKKQICTIVSMLTKLMHFIPKKEVFKAIEHVANELESEIK